MPPEGPSDQAITPIKATFSFDAIGNDFAGVRVHGQNNALEALYELAQKPDAQLVWEVSDIQLGILKSRPPQLSIHAQGVARSSSWRNPRLMQSDEPVDNGIYTFLFQADPPQGNDLPVLTPLDADTVLNPLPDDLTAVRIVAENNETVKYLSQNHKLIYQVNSVDLWVDGKSLTIIAKGDVSTSGWSNPQLIPYNYFAPPRDGIYDYSFAATPPDGIVLQVITPIDISQTIPLGSDVRGVRIHGKTGDPVEALLPQLK